MLSLFHYEVHVVVLGSGSRGNATYVGDGRRGVLIDAGLSARQLRQRLRDVGLVDPPIDAVLLTHEHSDHIGGVRVLDKVLAKERGAPVPFYASAGTLSALPHRPQRAEVLDPTRPFTAGTIEVEPTAVPHDTREPVAYTVDLGGIRVGVVTDLGRATHAVEARLATLDVAIVEFNHDVDRLAHGPYPWRLKQRIRSSQGHLSNTQASELIARAAGPRLRHLVLAHLSDENNTPSLALDAARQGLQRAGRAQVVVHVARQAVPTGPLRVARVTEPQRTRLARTHHRRAPAPPPIERQVSLFPGR